MWTVYEFGLSNGDTYTVPIPIDQIGAEKGGSLLGHLMQSDVIILNRIENGTETTQFVAINPEQVARVAYQAFGSVDHLNQSFWTLAPDSV
jgi:hypothetical protein